LILAVVAVGPETSVFGVRRKWAPRLFRGLVGSMMTPNWLAIPCAWP